MLLSTIYLTLLSYSLLFSLYIWAATLLAGDNGFGSDKSDLNDVNIAHTSYTGLHWFCKTKIKWKITVKANSAVFVNVRVEHLRLKYNVWSFIWVLFGEIKFQFKESSFPWSSFDTLDDGLPFEKVVL